ncbi:uncharacterized protein BCR38DRAFT_447535 [Pseudomassariella vexata]|uniref:Uncharacterized protein n=1 Tax=Pseudomassariella vexata TaxID=1141098 RepID=A0A1Y2DGZ0_9PEZI|nr:uncharacterized protein BCR38DRAFT_447535 [Pseudomassariella vexata]ORY58520.1 hypothetical protein BCR38DRAFT_447535 [Pseudomassariella vexata]
MLVITLFLCVAFALACSQDATNTLLPTPNPAPTHDAPIQQPSLTEQEPQTTGAPILTPTPLAGPTATIDKPTLLPPANSSNAPTSNLKVASSQGLSQFTQLVVFGDNLSDNGNGSSAHGVAGNPSFIYGFNTWTNGPIAASYLSTLLSLPLNQNFAFGHAAGGSKFGVTVDNSFTQSDAEAPDAAEQILNYTTSPGFNKENAEKSLHFFWFGNNDVLPWLMNPRPHIFFGAGADEGNRVFATDLATRIADNVGSLLDAGARKVIVPNIYPRHVAPVVAAYFGLDAAAVEQYGGVIRSVNSQLKTRLEAFGERVIYYDAFRFMINMHEQAKNGGVDGIHFMTPGADICDGASKQAVPGTDNWELCQVQGRADEFYWMQFLDPTTHVHRLVAEDMAKVVRVALG